MSGILATFGRELRAYFFSPLAYVVLAFFLAVNGYFFWIIVSFLNDPRSTIGAPLQLFFGQTVFTWIVLIIVGTFLTMRLLSEERRSGTIESLMTAPVSEAQVVIGKYLGALTFYLFLWAPSLAYVGIIRYFSEVDWGPIAASYLGIAGVGALFMAVGIFSSALTRNQIVAAIVTFACLFLFFTFGLLENLVNDPKLKQAFGYLDLWQHMSDFAKGIVDTRPLVYYATAIAFFLFLTARALAAKKWR